jgi:hypothetical protein
MLEVFCVCFLCKISHFPWQNFKKKSHYEIHMITHITSELILDVSEHEKTVASNGKDRLEQIFYSNT